MTRDQYIEQFKVVTVDRPRLLLLHAAAERFGEPTAELAELLRLNEKHAANLARRIAEMDPCAIR